jgi:uncharacterized protein (TIGR02246 family)
MLIHGTLFRPGQEPLANAEIDTSTGVIRQGPPSKQWIIPGLIDAHIHFFQSGGLYTRPDIIDLTSRVPYDEERRRIRENLPDTFRRYLASGVTGVVDCGGPFWNFDAREQARRTEAAPRVAVTGPLVSTFGPPALQNEDSPIIQCDTPQAARDLVKRQLDRKPDFIKIWYILLNRPPQTLLPIVDATMDEAHRAGLRVAVHATELETARAAVKAGADILVHSVFDREVDDEFLTLARRVIYIPTLMVVERYRQTLSHSLKLTRAEFRLGNPHVMGTLFDSFEDKPRPPTPAGMANLKRVFDAGITVAAGTDAGNIGTPHGPAIFRELELMVEAGLTPAQALACATQGGRRILGADNDYVVLNADPTADIRNVTKIDKIVRAGRVWTQEELVPRTPVDVVQEQVNAYNARDVEAFLATYSEDIVIIKDGQEVMRGHDQMRERYAKLFADYPKNHVDITKREVDGAAVIDHEHVTGRPQEVRVRARYEVDAGLIRRVTFLPA